MDKKILVLPGSLRKEALGNLVIGAFRSLAPEGVTLEVADLATLPLFNQDLETPEPEFLINFKQKIKEADGILVVTPEHNRSTTAVIKNALDWGSRPPVPNQPRVWDNKPAAIAGYSPYGLGGFGAVNHARQILSFLNMPVLPQPEFYLSNVTEKFNENGVLTDERTKEFVLLFWTKFIDFIDRLKE